MKNTETNNLQSQFVTYEIALKLKELGFSVPCFSAYTENGNLMDIGDYSNDDKIGELDGHSYYISCLSPLWQQSIDWCDSKGLLVGTIVVDNLYKSTINKINYETELFHSRNESIKRAIEFAISYLQDNK